MILPGISSFPPVILSTDYTIKSYLGFFFFQEISIGILSGNCSGIPPETFAVVIPRMFASIYPDIPS